jgi:hypothetical protein
MSSIEQQHLRHDENDSGVKINTNRKAMNTSSSCCHFGLIASRGGGKLGERGGFVDLCD